MISVLCILKERGHRQLLCRIALTAVITVVLYATPARAGKWTTYTTADGLLSNSVDAIFEDGDGNLWFVGDLFAGEERGVSRYDGTWTTFTTADGLADNLLGSILEDSEGNLWFGSLKGVSRYDETWTTFTTADGLANNSVGSILEDREGNLWFRTERGVSRYDGERWTTFTTADGLASNSVRAMLEDSEGNLWFGTREGVSRYDGERWTTFTATGGLAHKSVRAMLEDREGNLWFGTNEGVSRYDETWTTYTTSDGLADNLLGSILEDSEGNLWFRSLEEGVSRYDGERWTTFTTADGLASNSVRAMLEDSEGNLWFGTREGVSRYDGERWTTFTATDVLAHKSVWRMLEDREGNLWFGTNEGVSRYDETWTTYTTSDGLADKSVNSILGDREGNLWFGTFGGVSSYDGERWTTYTRKDGLAGNVVLTILEDSAGNLWFGTLQGVGVSRYDGEKWTTYNTADGLASNAVLSILEDSAGNLWFGTFAFGVSRYDGKKWTTYNTKDGLAHNQVGSIFEDSEGNLWFGTRGGVSRYDGERWTTFSTADGLAHNIVYTIFEDREGNLWFATGGGASRYDGERWTTYTTEDGLANNIVLTILKDSEGNLWFGTVGGVSRYDGERWTTYTTEDGLADNYVNAIFEDSEGKLWFGTLEGVTRYRVDRSPPNTFIFDGPKGIIGIPQAFFQYSGGDRYLPGADVQYAYAIKSDRNRPIEEDWSSFTHLTSTLTDPLSNGTYTFYVRASDKAGNFDISPAKKTFTVDLTAPTVLITSPSNDEIIHGEMSIKGSAFDNSDKPDFGSYTLEYGKGTDEDKISEWRSIRDSAVKPVINDLLGVWDTEVLFGTYVLRLRAVDGFDHRSKYAITVHVVAAAVEVDHSSGGHITDSASKVDLYIPPNGIPKSTQVTITPVALEGVAKPSALNLRLIGMAYDIGPKDLAVLKPATFTIFLNENDIQDVPDLGKLAIFTRSPADSPWERVGGTVDERTGKITVALTHFGRFAVMEDLSADEGSLSISDVNCQPRVFSPKGGGYDTKTTISFNLGRRSAVTVKVYDVSGRFKRKLVEDSEMNRGSNAVEWEGRDHDGEVVVSGLYVVAVEADGKAETKTVGVLNK